MASRVRKPRVMNGVGSIHDMSLLVGELKGSVDSLTNSVAERHSEAQATSREMTRNFDALRNDLHGVTLDVRGVKDTVATVQHDVSNIRMAQVEVKDTLENYKAVENRARGWWDVSARVLTGFRVGLGVLAVVGFMIFKDYILPRWL